METNDTPSAEPAAHAVTMDRMWGGDAVGAGLDSLTVTTRLRALRFGMFVHWGLYSSLAGRWAGKTYYGIGEWMMHSAMAGIPVAEYRRLASDFNPRHFDASAFVRLARSAGMRYIIITAKHHEGFAMFGSEADSFTIANSPFGRDPMRELADACRAAGLGFGFYYSHFQDWTTPGGARGPEQDDHGAPATFEHYFRSKCLPQVAEITTRYGELSFVWFDTPGAMEKKYIEELYALVRRNQPNALVNSRIGHGWGDYSSEGDMEIPQANVAGPWEACDTTNDSWSFAWYDRNWKDAREILIRLTGAAARGGAYLLNVGPDPDGRIPEAAAQNLRDAGAWIARHPQVVYGTAPSPWGHALPWGDVTVSANGALHLIVLQRPASGQLWLPGLRSPVTCVHPFREPGARLATRQHGSWTVITLPLQPASRGPEVYELTVSGALQVDPTPGVDPLLPTALPAAFAAVTGAVPHKAQWMEKFGEWKHAEQVGRWGADGVACWTVEFPVAGDWRISVRCRGERRLVWKCASDEGDFVQNQQGATAAYAVMPLGFLTIQTAGRRTLTVSLLDGNRDSASLEGIVVDKWPEGVDRG